MPDPTPLPADGIFMSAIGVAVQSSPLVIPSNYFYMLREDNTPMRREDNDFLIRE